MNAINLTATYEIRTNDGLTLAEGVPGAELASRAAELVEAHRSVYAYDESDADDDTGIAFGEEQW